MMKINILVISLMILTACTRQTPENTLLIEAESFEDIGGWVVDQQFMDQMGSPMLLAHGLGVPVRSARTQAVFPDTGNYHVWVRTRDWTATWNAPDSPGRFKLAVDGKNVPGVFGTQRKDWHWQYGGTVAVERKSVTVALCDLTGFEGRCDAVLFSKIKKRQAALDQFRKGLLKPAADVGSFDLVVTGGGIAGICAAVSAARLGCTVALIQDRPVLGGNNSSEVRVGLSGKINLDPYPELGNLVREVAPIGHYDFKAARENPGHPWSKKILAMDSARAVHNAGPKDNYEDGKKRGIVEAEKNIWLFLNTHVCRAEKNGDRITAVIGKNIRSGREMRFTGALFADCTGDGALGYLAGADFRQGREAKSETGEALAPDTADQQTMGTSVQWHAEKADAPSAFPDCPWALPFTEKTCSRGFKGDWNWETGFYYDQIKDFEYVRDYALRAVYGNWAFLKNRSAEKDRYENYRLAWAAYIGGKRESRRLLGDVILRQQDIEEYRAFPDASVTTTWSIDQHYPDPENTKNFPGGEFLSVARHVYIKPYPIPYRCFYSRNIGNLFMAGRDISVTHVALGTIRVQKTTGMMGEVVGMAASLCKKHGTGPRGVYKNHLDELKELMKAGTGKARDPYRPGTQGF